MKPVAVFDLDGTLVDTAPDLAASLNHCLRSARLPEVSLAWMRPLAGLGARVLLREAYALQQRTLGENDMDVEVRRFLAFYEANIAATSKPLDGAPEALLRLQDGGYRLAVCTNKHERLARLLLGELGLSALFDAVCGGDSFPQRKPHPAHLTGTVLLAGGVRDAAIMIGDSWNDIETAAAAGIPSVLIDCAAAPDERARRAADVVLPCFEELDARLADRLLQSRAARPLLAEAAA